MFGCLRFKVLLYVVSAFLLGIILTSVMPAFLIAILALVAVGVIVCLLCK